MKPHTSYFVCATPRSGTVLLCEALASTGVAGHPEEYFYELNEPKWAASWGLKDYSHAEYLEAALEHGTTPNGIFGVKMMWSLLDRFVCQVQQIPPFKDLDVPNVLGSAFPNLHYIWLTRRDKVAQAVSHWKGIQTGIWHVAGHEDQLPAREPTYDFQAIHHLVREVESHDAAWQRYFLDSGIEPFKMVYEDLVQRYEATVYELLAFLGVSNRAVNVAKPRTIKQADAVSDEWVQRYLRTVH